MAAWQQDRFPAGAARDVVAAASTDGGRTWRSTPLPELTTCSGGPWASASDPVVGFGGDGRAYVATLAITPGRPTRAAVLVSASPDGGRTWGRPVSVHEVTRPPLFPDKPSLLADPRRAGAVYVTWSEYITSSAPSAQPEAEADRDRILFARSADGGATWSAPIAVHGDGSSEASFSLLLPQPDGALIDVFVEGLPVLSADPKNPSPAAVRSARSLDQGEHWEAAVDAGRFQVSVVVQPGRRDPVRASGQMIGAAAGRDGALYAAWITSPSDGPFAIWVTRSDDGARSWTSPQTVVNQRAAAFIPTLAVAGDGAVGVLWYDFREARPDATALDTEPWFAISRDRGRSWQPRRLAAPFDLRFAPVSGIGPFLGDYQGAAGLRSGFALLFAMSRPAATHGPTDLFFVRL